MGAQLVEGEAPFAAAVPVLVERTVPQQARARALATAQQVDAPGSEVDQALVDVTLRVFYGSPVVQRAEVEPLVHRPLPAARHHAQLGGFVRLDRSSHAAGHCQLSSATPLAHV